MYISVPPIYDKHMQNVDLTYEVDLSIRCTACTDHVRPDEFVVCAYKGHQCNGIKALIVVILGSALGRTLARNVLSI